MKPEIHFLLSLIRHRIHQTEPDISFTFPSISEEKLHDDVCTFHTVRPLVFAIIKQYPFLFSDTFDTIISDFTQNQRMIQLKIQQSTTLLIQLFETKGIRATSFKGQLIEALLYPPYLPRESGDSDYLFSLQSMPDILTILAGQGYKPLIYQPSPFRKINTEKTVTTTVKCLLTQ